MAGSADKGISDAILALQKPANVEHESAIVAAAEDAAVMRVRLELIPIEMLLQRLTTARVRRMETLSQRPATRATMPRLPAGLKGWAVVKVFAFHSNPAEEFAREVSLSASVDVSGRSVPSNPPSMRQLAMHSGEEEAHDVGGERSRRDYGGVLAVSLAILTLGVLRLGTSPHRRRSRPTNWRNAPVAQDVYGALEDCRTIRLRAESGQGECVGVILLSPADRQARNGSLTLNTIVRSHFDRGSRGVDLTIAHRIELSGPLDVVIEEYSSSWIRPAELGTPESSWSVIR